MCWAQQAAGLTLLLLPAQHSCRMQGSSSPGEHPSPHPSPAPAPGGDTAQKHPGPQKPSPAYAGKGLCSNGALSWYMGWEFLGFICVMSLPHELWTPRGWKQGWEKGQAGAASSSHCCLPAFSQGSEAGRDQALWIRIFASQRVCFFSHDPFFPLSLWEVLGW